MRYPGYTMWSELALHRSYCYIFLIHIAISKSKYSNKKILVTVVGLNLKYVSKLNCNLQLLLTTTTNCNILVTKKEMLPTSTGLKLEASVNWTV